MYIRWTNEYCNHKKVFLPSVALTQKSEAGRTLLDTRLHTFQHTFLYQHSLNSSHAAYQAHAHCRPVLIIAVVASLSL